MARKVIRVQIKNVGSAPAVIYNTSGTHVRIGVGQTVQTELPEREARRLDKAYQKRDGTLMIVNQSDVRSPEPVKRASELRDSAGKPQTEVKPGVKERRHNTDEDNSKYAREKKTTVRPEIKTAAQALAAMSDGDPLGYPQLLSVSTRILPEGAMPLRPKKEEIIKALEKQARKDAK